MVIDLNVGGEVMSTFKSTLTRIKDSMLAAMFSGLHPITKDKKGRAFIDRNPKFFRLILEYLRTDVMPIINDPYEREIFQRELVYFGIPKIWYPYSEEKKFGYTEYQSWATYGYAFDIKAKNNNIIITGLALMARNAGKHYIEVFYRFGTCIDNETNPAAWIKLIANNYDFPEKQKIRVEKEIALEVKAGDTISFYIYNRDKDKGGIVSGGEHDAVVSAKEYPIWKECSHFTIYMGPSFSAHWTTHNPPYQCGFLGMIFYKENL